MKSLDDLLEECQSLHGHLCPGQILGARMSLLGCRLIGLDDPREADRKKLIVWVEIDRCMADAVGAVTGARLGRRTLKYLDYGKVAATFLNTETGTAVRIVAREDSRQLADTRFAAIASKKERQIRAYREVTDGDLFDVAMVKVSYDEMDAPGRPRSRIICGLCGESVNDGREVFQDDGSTLCKPCVNGQYYRILTPIHASDNCHRRGGD